MENEELGVQTDEFEEVATEQAEAPPADQQEAVAAPPPPPQQQIDPVQMMWMQQQQLQYQLAQIQQHNAYLAAQLQQQQMRQMSAPPEQTEEMPDAITEPDKYFDYRLKQQYAPIQSQLQELKQQQLYQQVMMRAQEMTADPRFSDYQEIYPTILQMAQNVPMEELAKPGALELLYYTAAGVHAKQQRGQQAQAPANAQPQQQPPQAAPQGHWPGAKNPPPPVNGSGSVGAPQQRPRTQLSAEQKEMARKAGMSEAEYAKYI